jgi:SPP1 gp7 family putative phage head morphogenesis protein
MAITPQTKRALSARTKRLKASKRRAPRPTLPTAAELAYVRELRALARRLARELTDAIRGALRVREDAIDDPDWDGLRVRFEAQAEAQARGIVDRHGQAINAHVRRDQERILRVPLARETPRVRERLRAWRQENVDLITSIPARHLDDMRRLVGEAQSTGMRVETLAARIQEREDVSASRAELIARDQTLKANAQLTEIRHADAGITEYEWSTSRDERVRGNPDGLYPKSQSDHFVLEGTRHRWDNPPDTGAGERNHPGEDYQCRCVAIPVIPDADFGATILE